MKSKPENHFSLAAGILSVFVFQFTCTLIGVLMLIPAFPFNDRHTTTGTTFLVSGLSWLGATVAFLPGFLIGTAMKHIFEEKYDE